MNDLEKVDLKGAGPDEIRRTPPPESPDFRSAASEDSPREDRRGLIVGLVLAVLLVAVAVWFWQSRGGGPGGEPPLAAVGEADVIEIDDEPEVDTPEVEDDLGPAPFLDESDGWVRTAVGAVTSHPAFLDWLSRPELIRTFVRVVANVAHDEVPQVHVPFLQPQRAFAPMSSGQDLVIDPASYDRFALLVEVFGSIDSNSAAEAYRRSASLCEDAYAELGFGGSFESALAVATDKMLAVDVPAAPPRLRSRVQSYEFVDDDLERLSDAQKILIRLGPQQANRVQAKLRELAAAVGVI